MNAVRHATRELRWEQIQAAIAELLQLGHAPITLQEIASRCQIPRSTLSKESEWKEAIQRAEAERQRRRAEELQQLRIGFLNSAAAEEGGRPLTLEGVIADLHALLAQASMEATLAFQRGHAEAAAGLDERRAAEAFELGRERGRQEATEALQPHLNEAFERGRERGRHEATEALETQLKEAFARGSEQGRSQFQEDLNSAYQRGLQDGKLEAGDPHEAFERGRAAGRAEGSEQGKRAHDQGRQLGRAEAQVELKQTYDRLLAEAKAEARSEMAAELHTAYDRGRHDGWDEGRREAASGGRGFFGFNVSRANPDREWALAILHCAANATPDQMRLAYRTLTKVYHPDRNPDLSPDFIRNLNRTKEILGF